MNDNLHILINDSIKIGIANLPEHLADWAKSHVCDLKRVKLSKDPDGKEFSYYWLVTDNTGSGDSSYRVVYDEESKMFGLECTLGNGLEWYMGAYGTFVETINSM